VSDTRLYLRTLQQVILVEGGDPENDRARLAEWSFGADTEGVRSCEVSDTMTRAEIRVLPL
jgi:hypothetical protein